MSKSTIVIGLVATVVFLSVAGVFEFLHRSVDTTDIVVDAQVSAPFEGSLDTSFADSLQERQQNALGQDLEY